MEIYFDETIRRAAPGFKVLLMEANIRNTPTPDALWQEIEDAAAQIRATLPMELIRHRPSINAIREAYRVCGKEPNRYRSSSEALCRRVVKGLALYRSLTAIDLINLASMLTGHSIGGFDSDKIVGDALTLGVGRAGEPYEGIGRGELNIEGMPVYRDAAGGVGTPTSDNERTKLSAETQHLIMTVNIYGEDTEYTTEQVESLLRRLLTEYASAQDIRSRIVSID